MSLLFDMSYTALDLVEACLTTLLRDPKLFNYVLVGLYTLNACRWAIHGSWGDATYWTGALIITIAITWGYAR